MTKKLHQTHFTIPKEMPWKKEMNSEESNMEVYFDYEILGRCQYPVPSVGPKYEDDCDEPATYKISWYIWENGEETFKEEMLVCIEHFNKVLEEEEVDLG